MSTMGCKPTVKALFTPTWSISALELRETFISGDTACCTKVSPYVNNCCYLI